MFAPLRSPRTGRYSIARLGAAMCFVIGGGFVIVLALVMWRDGDKSAVVLGASTGPLGIVFGGAWAALAQRDKATAPALAPIIEAGQ